MFIVLNAEISDAFVSLHTMETYHKLGCLAVTGGGDVGECDMLTL